MFTLNLALVGQNADGAKGWRLPLSVPRPVAARPSLPSPGTSSLPPPFPGARRRRPRARESYMVWEACLARPPEGRHPSLSDLRLVVITGLSGAGKTEASRVLEDAGYYVVDNLPASLIPTFAELCRKSAGIDRAALVIDIRGREFFADAAAALAQIESEGVPFEILFLEADEDTLIQRYKESRRRHPMAPEGRVADGIAEERLRLGPLRGRAHRIIDTGGLPRADLRARLRDLYAGGPPARLRISVVSFGFKHGLPPDADLVLDVRFLPNPFYVPELRARSGREPEVAEYVLGWPATRRFLDLASALLDFLVPNYQSEGRAELVIAIGCTGGRHRSVVVARSLAEHLRGPGRGVAVVHRDCDLEGGDAADAAPPPSVPGPGAEGAPPAATGSPAQPTPAGGASS